MLVKPKCENKLTEFPLARAFKKLDNSTASLDLHRLPDR